MQTITIIELALLFIGSILVYTLIKTIFQDLTKYK
jgi:uncharacterized membrane protein YhdT